MAFTIDELKQQGMFVDPVTERTKALRENANLRDEIQTLRHRLRRVQAAARGLVSENTHLLAENTRWILLSALRDKLNIELRAELLERAEAQEEDTQLMEQTAIFNESQEDREYGDSHPPFVFQIAGVEVDGMFIQYTSKGEPDWTTAQWTVMQVEPKVESLWWYPDLRSALQAAREVSE